MSLLEYALVDRLNAWFDKWKTFLVKLSKGLAYTAILFGSVYFWLNYIRAQPAPIEYGEVRVLNPILPAGTILRVLTPFRKIADWPGTVSHSILVPEGQPPESGQPDKGRKFPLLVDRRPTTTMVGEGIETDALMIPGTMPPGVYELEHAGSYVDPAGKLHTIKAAPVVIRILPRIPVPTEDSP